jgi:regulatory protein YycI of two-component signal transduction system YycFG
MRTKKTRLIFVLVLLIGAILIVIVIKIFNKRLEKIEMRTGSEKTLVPHFFTIKNFAS